jgi:uncharacterized membrane protein
MKKILLIILLVILFIPTIASASTTTEKNKPNKQVSAEITEVAEKYYKAENDEGKKFIIDRNTQYKLAGQVHKGDSVILKEVTQNGTTNYIISSFDRTNSILLLFALFLVVLLLVNGKRGLKSMINLAVTYCVILLAIIPLILQGYSPVLVAVIGGILAMGWNIYFTHGFTNKSHATIIGIAGSLAIVGILGWIFIQTTSLSGSIEQGSNILSAVGYDHINFRGLLLAAVLIGALGVLDDLVISQVSLVEELKNKKPDLSKSELFKSAMKVGHDHTSAIVNTLVLAYTSASFPLVILFSVGVRPFNSLTNTLNNETVATELVRMLVGGIGILLSMPMATLVAIYFLVEE